MTFVHLQKAARSFFSAICLMSIAGACGPRQMIDNLDDAGSHIPPIARESAQGGPLEGNEVLYLSVALPLRNEEQLDAALAAMYDPKSEKYGQFLSPDVFAERHHPTAEAVAEVRDALSRHNLLADEHAHGILLGVYGTVADVEQAFSTALYHFTAFDGSEFSAPATEPVTPADLHIAAIHGLVGGRAPQPFYQRRMQVDAADLESANADTDGAVRLRTRAMATASPYLTPATMRKAYAVPSAARGRGQSIGLFQMDSYDPNDIAQFARINNLPQPNITAIRLDGATSRVVDANIQVEVQLDIELAMAMAPDATEIRLYQGISAGGVSGYQHYLKIFNEMANPSLGDRKLIRNLSTSYGYFEIWLDSATLRSEGVLFKQMAAQGQTLFSAAGDTGAFTPDGQKMSVVDPAIQPFVVAVGGTRITTGVDGTYTQEVAWSGSGGGISRVWEMPAYQSKVVANNNNIGSRTQRNAPDVSMDADPNSGFEIIYQGNVIVVGGTSAAAPLWAGVNALINEQRSSKGLKPLGFFNPILYSVAATSGMGSLFNDITQGNNGTYNAFSGYDNATGWGTPKVGALLDAFSQGYVRVPFVMPSWPLQ